MMRAMDDQIKQLADNLYQERVERARRMPPAEKLLAGGDLFDHACSITKAGIRMQNPHYSEEQVLAELRRRLEMRRRREYPELRGSK